jgi:hypothetical protein
MVSAYDDMDHFCWQIDLFIGYITIWYEQQRFSSDDLNGSIIMKNLKLISNSFCFT